MGGKGKASKLKHHGMSGIEEVADAADAFNGGGIDRPNGRGRERDIRGREMGRPRPPLPPRPSLNLIVSIIGFSNTVM